MNNSNKCEDGEHMEKETQPYSNNVISWDSFFFFFFNEKV